jgi:ElaB/YqjD/DUF883 family membrane-anchored ribosome-binding protein
MSSHPSSGKASVSTPSQGSKLSETSGESTSTRVESEHGPPDALNEVVGQLGRDVGSLKDTFTRLASQLGDAGTKTVRNVSQTVASQVGTATSGIVDTGSDLASSAKEHAKTFASELESMARRNPLGTIAGALLVGVIIGMMSRGRS